MCVSLRERERERERETEGISNFKHSLVGMFIIPSVNIVNRDSPVILMLNNMN